MTTNPELKIKYRKIPSTKFLYEVSKDGKIRNVKSKKHLKPKIINGYASVGIHCKEVVKNARVNRLVAEVWVKNIKHPEIPLSDLYVHHKNFNKLDNRAENLEWVTHSENIAYDWENGRREHAREVARQSTIKMHERGAFPVTEAMRKACRQNSLDYKERLKETNEYYQRNENTLICLNGEEMHFKTIVQSAKYVSEKLNKKFKTVYVYLLKRKYAYGYKIILDKSRTTIP